MYRVQNTKKIEKIMSKGIQPVFWDEDGFAHFHWSQAILDAINEYQIDMTLRRKA